MKTSSVVLTPLLSLLALAGSCRRLDTFSSAPVGEVGLQRYVTPVHQVLTPAGIQVELPGMRPYAVALSPDGHLLATSGKTQELVLIDPQTGDITQRVMSPSSETRDPDDVSSHILKPDESGQLSYTGLLFSPDGSRIYMSNVNGDIKVFGVDADGQVRGLSSIGLPAANAPWRKEEIPAGLALSPDGRRLYVVLNLSNRLAEIDANTGEFLRSWKVGVAPYDVVLTGNKAYVSNWGGRLPEADSLTGPAGQGTRVRVDPVRHIASEGSVSVIHLNQDRPIDEIMVGLHSSAITTSPNGHYAVVANAGSDTLSVIDAGTDKVVETIWAKSAPADLFGASPNTLVFNPSGDTIYVANGTQNAIAVIRFHPGECFTTTPNLTAYGAMLANVPLDRMNPNPKAVSNPILRRDAIASAKLPLEEADRCPEGILNRILWHAMRGPYESYLQWAVVADLDDD